MSRVETLHRQRERAAEAKVLPPLPHRFVTAVVGVTFAPSYPDGLYRLEAAAVKARVGMGGDPLPVTLRREPGNPHDPNAVEVVVESIGPIGHVPAALARRLAPFLDAGGCVVAGVTHVRVDPHQPERPGIDVEVWRA